VKVVIAPGALAGSTSAADVARAMSEGWRRVRPKDDLLLLPMQVTVDAIAMAVPRARRVVVEVADPRGCPVHAAWLTLPGGRAVVEAAQACGPSLLAEDERDPLLTTSYGVGQLIADAALEHREIVIGLGESAAVDGGGGMATALGHKLRRADGNGVKVGGQFLLDLEWIEPGPALSAAVLAACDVAAPLLGPSGAVPASASELLETALARLAEIAERDLDGGPWRDLAGAGASGGLGFGLAAFCGARLEPSTAVVADLLGLDHALEDAAAVLTGEGAAADFVASHGRERGVRVVSFAIRACSGDIAARAADFARTIGW